MLALTSIGGATETISTDGVWWNTLTESEKDIAMFAATSAYAQGYVQGEVRRASYQSDLDRARDEHFKISADVEYAELIWEMSYAGHHPFPKGPAFWDRGIGSYVERMNYFYSSHPERSELNFSVVLQCIEDYPSKSCDAVAKDGS